jgi:predicted aspartyl protease
LGIAGETRAFNFDISRMKMGPVEKSEVPVTVIDGSAMKYPLLGQPFYKDWQLTIDHQNHVIRLLHR